MQQLLSVRKIFKHEDEGSFCPVFFYVPVGVGELEITIKQSPKRMTDYSRGRRLLQNAYAKYAPHLAPRVAEHMPLANMVTFSVDSPSGLVGTYHVGPAVGVYKIGKNSSNGFKDTPITTGEWAVDLCVCMVNSEQIEVELEVRAI